MKKFRSVVFGLGAGLFLAALYGYRLNFPPVTYFDEVHHVGEARRILALGVKDFSHPPLGRLLIGLGIRLCGDRSWAWRFFPCVAGLATVVVIYFLAKRLTGNPRLAFFAGFLFCFDCISLTQARIAMLNAAALLFMLLSVLFFLPYAQSKEGPRSHALLKSGIFLGLALATKLVSAMILGVMMLLWVKVWRKEKEKLKFVKETFIFWIFIPLAIYFASYSFFFFIKGKTLRDIWQAQVAMIYYHTHLKAGHHYSSKWWTWPLMIRPIWYYFKRENGLVYGILSIGNPAVFWLIPAAVSYAAWTAWRRKSFPAALVTAGFFIHWVSFAFMKRIKFFHYFDMVMPFVVIAFALLLEKMWCSGKGGKALALGYLILVAGFFIYWYPLLTGFPISEHYFRNHLWFKSWV